MTTGGLLATGPSGRVLVVDDEPGLVNLVTRTLRMTGLTVSSASTVAAALDVAEEFAPDLAVLDILLPDGSGLDLCHELRTRNPGIGVVFLSARDAVPDRLHGFSAGGDDYVTKPFSVAELAARVGAVLHRIRPSTDGAALVVDDLCLRDDVHEVTRGEVAVDLSPTEYRLLRYLLVNAGRVLSKEQILSQVWQYEYLGDATVVEKFVSQLRRKIDAGGPPLIHTVRGFGYVLRSSR
ncbi:response regulator transcription factor [Nocardioides sp.]|uniref:response regulator transcription factor n=1 Tax=Nocardioides sp. TaxID=35761 RepID=UPI001A1BE00F|nr:response regulator transcription factor [Nocardioides sp.]MBJ7355925.1 response regulator transcription factor [Nocardioides sp.]